MKFTFCSLLALSLLAALPLSHAQETIASWDLTSQPGDQVSTTGTGATGVTAAPVSRGSGITAASSSFSNNSIAANGWNDGGDNRYYTFGFTVQAGNTVQLTDFAVGSRTDATGPRDFALRYSVDGFTANLGTWQETGSFFVNTLIDLSSIAPITGQVEFRIVAISDIAANGGAIAADTLHRLTNYFSGGNTGSFRFTGTVTSDGLDESPPEIASTSPLSESFDVPVGTGLTITFNESIVKGTGSILIYDAVDGTFPALEIDVTSTDVVASGNSLNVTLPSNLEFEKTYYILLDGGIVADSSGNAFIGLGDETFWTFTTRAPGFLEWNFQDLPGGAQNFGPSPYDPVSNNPNLTVIGLQRGPGLVIEAGTGAAGAWGSNTWGITNSTFQQALSAGKFVSFVVGPQTGFSMSLSEIPAYNIRRSSSGPTTGQWQFRVGSGEFQDLGSPITWGGTTSSTGNTQAAISLSGIPELQNVPPGTPVAFRIVNWGATSEAGTWYFNRFGDAAAPDLVVLGTVEASTEPGDNVPPAIVSTSPATGANNVLAEATLSITFDEDIYPLTGDVRIFDASTDTEVDAIPIATAQVIGNVVNLTPNVLFTADSGYYVLIDSGILKDFAGNVFGGISDPTFWTFTASDDTFPPELLTVNPSGTDVNIPTQLVATFNENVLGEFGGLVNLHLASDDSILVSYDVSDFGDRVDFIENQMFVNVEGDVVFGESYYVTINENTISDAVGNLFPGILDTTTWAFSTRDVLALLDTAPYEQDFLVFVSLETLPDEWSLAGPAPSLVYFGDWADGFNAGLRGNASVLGFQPTGSAIELTKTLIMKNGSSGTITDLTIKYTGRAARIGEANVNRLPGYVVTVNGVEVTALAYSTGEGDGIQKGTTLSGLNIPPGGPIVISWFTDRGLPSDSSRQIGLSDVSVSIGAEDFPPALAGVTVDPGFLTFNSASVASAVTSDNNSPVTERGFVYAKVSVTATPEIGGTGVVQIIDDTPEVGAFSATLSGLSASTSYAVRSYAVNANGTAYSTATGFTTRSTPPNFVGDYFQSFSTFTGVPSLPTEWAAFSTTGSNAYAGVWGSGINAGFRGVGEIDGVPSGPVLGYQHTAGTGELFVSLTLVNATGEVIDELFVQYLGRVERAGEGRSPAWTVEVNGEVISELGYSTSLGEDTSVEAVLSGLNIPDGASFTIRWKAERDEFNTGSYRQIGLANVLVSTTIPSPPTSGTFGDFMAGFFPGETDPNIIGLFANPSGDSIPNILKYYYGADPRFPSQGLREVGSDGSSVTFEFTRNKNLGDDIVAEYQWTNNLSDWFASGSNGAGLSVTITEEVIDDTDLDFDVVRITATVTEGSADRLFLRIEVSDPFMDAL